MGVAAANIEGVEVFASFSRDGASRSHSLQGHSLQFATLIKQYQYTQDNLRLKHSLRHEHLDEFPNLLVRDPIQKL